MKPHAPRFEWAEVILEDSEEHVEDIERLASR